MVVIKQFSKQIDNTFYYSNEANNFSGTEDKFITFVSNLETVLLKVRKFSKMTLIYEK